MKLKKWVKNLLIGVSVIAFIIFISECKSTLIFVVSKVIALSIMILNERILEKYGR